MATKVKHATKVSTKFDSGVVATREASNHAGQSAKRHIITGVGKAAFGVGAAFGAVTGFAKGLFS